MADTDRPFGLSRRYFIGSTLTALGAALVPGCGSGERSRSTPAGAATPPAPTNSATSVAPPKPIEINVGVPALLVFRGRERIPGLVQLTAAQRDTGQATVAFHDSRGRTVAYDAGASFAEGIRRRGKTTRESVAPKVLAAYILDSTWQMVRRERVTRAFAVWRTTKGQPLGVLQELETVSQLGRDFFRLQEQAVLDNVSVGAVVAFLESIAQRVTVLSHVTWDERDKRIVASFDLEAR